MDPTEAGIRNFKDFLQIYNSMTESCFNFCIDNHYSRNLDDNEVACVDRCAQKYVKLNHKIMALYVDAQQIIVERKIKEAEQEMAQNETLQSKEQNLQIMDNNVDNVDEVRTVNGTKTKEIDLAQS